MLRYNGNIMSKRQILMLLGAWMIVFLFLGFPHSWDKLFAVVCGLLVIAISYRIHPQASVAAPRAMPYVEHKSPASAPTGTIISPNPENTNDATVAR